MRAKTIFLAHYPVVRTWTITLAEGEEGKGGREGGRKEGGGRQGGRREGGRKEEGGRKGGKEKE